MNIMANLFFALVMTLVSFCLFAQQNTEEDIFMVTYLHPQPVVTKGDSGTEDNIYGFEGGRAVKMKDGYHIFTTEMNGEPVWTVTRLAHWKSKDGIKWKRVSSLFESSGNFDGSDTHAALWSPMPTFNKITKRWNLTYVCYRSKPNTKEAWYRNYDGRIARAESILKGKKGIGGPYKEIEIMLQPDSLYPKLGLMGVDSFFPYQTNNGWYAFYGSSPEWNGLAQSPALTGPWKRLENLGVVTQHTENPIVTRLEDGRYVAFFDGCGVYQKFGYLISQDGVNWSNPIIIDLDEHPSKWWGLSRTPLGLINEGNGIYTLYFTAYNKNFYDIPGIWSAGTDEVFKGYFASIGMLKLKLKE
jgi:hypothetical protein